MRGLWSGVLWASVACRADVPPVPVDRMAAAMPPPGPTTKPEVSTARATTAPAPRRISEIAPPGGFGREAVAPGSLGEFTRGLSLRPDSTVRDFRGDVVVASGDPRVHAVIELDVSSRGVQECADSIIRIHAEWLWAKGEADRIRYAFVSGDWLGWSEYADGKRPVVDGNKVRWTTVAPERSRDAFRVYLDLVFNYASTISLARTTEPVARDAAAPGDFFVQPGGPGHAVMVLDVATARDGRRVALLAQGFMPAQDFHVLATPTGPWFSLDSAEINTPFWRPFAWSDLRRFPASPTP